MERPTIITLLREIAANDDVPYQHRKAASGAAELIEGAGGVAALSAMNRKKDEKN